MTPEEAQAFIDNLNEQKEAETWMVSGPGNIRRRQKLNEYGEVVTDIGNGTWIGQQQYTWSVQNNRYERRPIPIPRYGEVEIAAQEQAPENPGIRREAFSTHGIVIPVSTGRRLVTGNVVDASDIVPTLIGAREYYVEYKIPIYADYGGVS